MGPKKPAPLIESVNLGLVDAINPETPGEKDEEFSVGGPAAATLVLGGTPIQEQLVKV